MSRDLDDMDLNADGASAAPAEDASGAVSAAPAVTSGVENLSDSVNEGVKTGVEGVPEVEAAVDSKECEGKIESSNGGADESKTVVKTGFEGVPEVKAAEDLKDCEGKVESNNGGVDDSKAVEKSGVEGVPEVKGAVDSKECEGKIESSNGGADDSKTVEKTGVEGVPEIKAAEDLKDCEVKVESSNGGVDDSKAVEKSGVEGVPEVKAAKDCEGKVESSNGGVDDSKAVEKLGVEGVPEVKAAKDWEGKAESSNEEVDDSEEEVGPVKANMEMLDLGMQGGEEERFSLSGNEPGNEDAETLDRQNRVSKEEETIKASKHMEDQKFEIDEPKPGSEAPEVILQENEKTQADNSDPIPSTEGSSTKSGRSRSKFADSDLVWAKVRSHPWWPGQIIDTPAASDQAKKYVKKEGHLIAYFGDQSFAWNETSKVKPFRAHFSQMAKQSKSEEFHDAIDCALDEVSRRVEFGLACPCVAEYKEIKTQLIVNPGIKDEYSRRDGGDVCSSAASFHPEKLVEYIKGIGQSPLGGVDRLEFLTARSQVLALSRWKGYSQLPELQILGTVLGEQVDVKLSEVELIRGSDENEKKTSSPSKRKGHSIDKERTPAKKEKTLADLIAERRSNDKSKSESKAIGKSSDGKKRRVADLDFDDSADKKKKNQTHSSPEGSGKNSSSAKKQSFGIGLSILKVASEMNGSSPILKPHDDGASGRRTKEKQKGSSKKPAKAKGKQSPTKGDSPATKAVVEEEVSDPALDEKSLLETKNGEVEEVEPPPSDEQGGTSTPDQQNGGEEDVDVTDAVMSEQVEVKPSNNDDDPSPTALILNFTDLETVPSVEQLNKIFGSFGTLKESETQVLKKSSRARVVFCKRDDAEAAFSSAGKYSTFGPSLVSYRLKYCSSPKKPSAGSRRKSSSSGKK